MNWIIVQAPIFLADLGLLRWPRQQLKDVDVPMNDKIEAPECNDQDLLAFDLAFDIADEALEAAAEKSNPAFTLIGSPTVSILVACCG